MLLAEWPKMKTIHEISMTLRRSRRLAGLPPLLDGLEQQQPTRSVDVQKEIAKAGFTSTLIGAVVVTSAVVFMTLWN